MKRLLLLCLTLLSLSGCAVRTASTARTEPASPPVFVMSSPELTSAPSAPESAASTGTESVLEVSVQNLSTTAEPTISVQTTTDSATASAPELPDPPPVPYGDTTPTWRPELAACFPADRDCNAALLLEKWMTVEGLTAENLEERACQQLILVAAQPTDGVEAVVVCYERSAEGSFIPVQGLDALRGFVGKNGIKHNRRRNTNTSPAGLWAIGTAFGNELPPDNLKLPWRQVTPRSDWICDENSPYFNTWQERGDPSLTPWSDDVEHLEDYPTLYAWACVIEFNRPPDVVPDRGCAIFLHCSKGGTGGCVGLPRETMLAVLRGLDAEKNPYILISGTEAS